MPKTRAVAVRVTNLNRMLRAISSAKGPDGNRRLRDAGQGLAERVAVSARRKAMGGGPQAAMAAPAIQAKRDRVPTIRMGGGKTLRSSTPRRRQPKGGDVIFGADFGADSLRQFPREVRGGRYVFQAVKTHRDDIAESYLDVIDDLFSWRR